MFATVNLAAGFAQKLANATGRSLEKVVFDLATRFEFEMPEELDRAAIQDTMDEEHGES